MIGEKLGSYQIESILGTGAMGVVYRATHETTGKSAAVKVVSGDVATKSKSYERFRREAEILQQFRHPNIVRFLAVGRFKGTSYFAMEFVPGTTLEDVLKRRGPLPWREVVELGVQLCDALHYAHEHGVVHRDLKPSNLMITESGQLKLTDFGIAKDLDATALTATGRTLGTAAYMAPEQIRGTPAISHKTDLYSMGVVLYQLLTGEPAFKGTTAVVMMHCHLNEPPPRPSAKTAEIPKAVDALVVQLMAKDPTERPWDAAAVAVKLAALLEKTNQGETVAMVWPAEGTAASHPTRAGFETGAGTRSSKGKKSGRRSSAQVMGRNWLEPALLVSALMAIVGFLTYMLWPPGAGYLFRQAEALMASKHRHDWIDARDNYLDPLDRRFPSNPYHKTSRAWRDRILLDEAEGRARILASSVRTKFTEPATKSEHQFDAFNTQVNEALRQGDERAAVAFWREMMHSLRPDDPEERPWFLLAGKRATELQKSIDDRRAVVTAQLARAETAARTGRPREALAIRGNLLTRYGRYTDLTDLFEQAGLIKAPEAPTQAGPSSP